MKKWISILLILAVMLSMAACGVDQPEPVATAPKAEIPPTEYLPYEGETLTVLYMSGSHADAARAIVPEFEAETGAKVEVVDFSYEELYEQSLLDLVSYIGTYDVINIDARWDGEFAPYLEPLDAYIEQDNYDLSVWIDNVLANSGKWQDTVIGIPSSCMPHVFAYRTDLLPDGIPDTWNTYRAALSRVNKPSAGVHGISVCLAPYQAVDVFNRILWSMGGAWADEDWNVTIESKEARSALYYLMNIRTMYDSISTQWSAEESIQAFLEGKAAVCETLAVSELLEKGNDPDQSQIVGNWAFDMIPKDATGLTSLSAWNTVIPVGSRNKDLAWKWIQAYTSYDAQNMFYDEFSIFSPRKAFWEQEKMADLSVIREALDYGNMAWRISAYAEAEDAVSEILGSFFARKIQPEGAVRQMKKAIETALENMPPQEGFKNTNH